ncbi:MAG TPA: M28 family peptidase [Woeseiaceae bacterium]|nr:M28 family peptidase [Woeseiaceae bacterium]
MPRSAFRHAANTFAAVAIVSIAACSPPAEDPPPASQAAIGTEDHFSSSLAVITRENLQEHLNFLADDARAGRMTGTRGYDEAAAYVAQQFEALGLTAGGDEGWYQNVPMLGRRLDIESAAVTLHRDSGDSELQWKEDFVMGGDEMRPETSVTAEVVFAGYGVHAPEMGYSDYEDIDVRGKIVAVFGGAPQNFPHNERAFYSSGRTKAEEMVKRGAVGRIGLRSRVDQKRVPWERLTLNAGILQGMSWINLSGQVADYHPEIEGEAAFSVPTAAELFEGAPITFEEALDAAEAGRPFSTPLGTEVTLSQKTRHEQVESPNVIGIVPGSDPTLQDEYVVFSAHLDHLGIGAPVDGDEIYNGYYDNAMGVSLLIEAARAFAAMPEPPRRSILFIALTGEERGLIGSDYFAHYPTVASDSLVANVNLDMPLLLYPLADVIAFGAEHSTLQQLIEPAVAAEDFALTPDPVPEEVLFIRSDQYSFVRQGLPSVFLVPGFTSMDPQIDGAVAFQEHLATHYHRPSDDSSRPVDWNSALRFARANVRIGSAIADADERPHWNEGDFFGERFARPATTSP